MAEAETQDEDRDASFDQEEWTRFSLVYTGRRRQLQRERQKEKEATTPTKRVLLLAGDEARPWDVFGLSSHREYSRRVFELSSLHFSPLHAASACGDLETVRQLIQAGAACTLADDACGRLALHHAVINEHHLVVQYLLALPDARQQLHVKDHRDATPVQYVLEKMLRLSLKSCPGANPASMVSQLRRQSRRYHRLWGLADAMLPRMGHTTLVDLQPLDCRTRGDVWDAVRSADADRLQQLFWLYPSVNRCLVWLQRTLLHEACESPRRDLKTLLIVLTECGRDRLANDVSGATPLHYAAAGAWLEACVLLLDEDALLTIGSDSEQLLLAVDERGRTPLHKSLAFRGRQHRQARVDRGDAITTARFLIERCSQALHVLDHDGYTPLHHAICRGDRLLVELMITLGAGANAAVRRDGSEKGEYGERAPWAPCGLLLRRRRKARLPINSSSSDAKTEQTTSPHRVSMVCERLRRVRAGQVEHPGLALPMETLWFWVHAKQVRHQTEDAPVEEERSAVPLDPRIDVDEGTYGCRRYGAVCPSCLLVPGRSDFNQQQLIASPWSVVSPLTIALRSCRLTSVCSKNDVSERVAIVEMLILAGATVEDEELREAMHVDQPLPLVDLVLAHSSRRGLLHLVIRQVSSSAVCPRSDAFFVHFLGHLNDAGMLEIVPWLVRYHHFRAVETLVTRRASIAGEILHAITSRPEKPRHRFPRPSPVVVDMLIVWKSQWPEYSTEVGKVLVLSIDEAMRDPPNLNVERRNAMDRSVSNALAAVLLDATVDAWMTSDQFLEWLQQSISKGWLYSSQVLLPHIIKDPTLLGRLIQQLRMPIRPVDVGHLGEWEAVARGLVIAAVESSDVSAVESLTLACAYNLDALPIQRLITRVVEEDQLGNATRALCSRQSAGRAIVETLVEIGRLDIVELLVNAIVDGNTHEMCLRVFKAVVSSSTKIPDIAGWIDLLKRFVNKAYVTETLVLAEVLPRSISAHDSVRTWLVDGILREAGDDMEGWMKEHSVLHHVARWNTIAFFSYLTTQTSIDSSTWATLVTQKHPKDSLTPIQLAELLGHARLARILRSLTTQEAPVNIDDDLPWTCIAERRRVGLMRTTLSLRLDIISPAVQPKSRTLDPLKVFDGDWMAAVALNDVRALAALDHHTCPHPSGDGSVALAELVEAAIRHGAMVSLQWILDSDYAAESLSQAESSRLLLLAARHSSDLYATMVWMLLSKYNFHAGRLSGDGTDTTLLHFAAAFADSGLASQVIDALLVVGDADVNVRDGFGWTPVAYAIAAGRIETACKLMCLPTTRLEAEYEGQTTLYYTLHLLPSFSWRWIAKAVLTVARSSAFLHCTSDDCACKSFESTQPSIDATEDCAFCSHPLQCHARVPYPPWFRDQYDTYILAADLVHEDTASQCGEQDEEDEEERERARQRRLLGAPVVDEAMIEQERGRLVEHDLLRVTQLRFDRLLKRVGVDTSRLQVPPSSTSSSSSDDDDGTGIEDTVESEDAANLSDASASTSAIGSVPQVCAVSSLSTAPLHLRDDSAASMSRVSATSTSRVSIDPSILPWFLRGDVASLHSDDCRCMRHTNTTAATRCAVLRSVLHRWLSLASTERWREGPSLCVLSLPLAWRQWRRRVTSPPVTTSTSEGRRVSSAPVAFSMTTVENKNTFADASGEQLVVAAGSRHFIGPHVVTWDPHAATPSHVSILQLFLFHWRYARVYQCFQRWKRRAMNAQVVHHELETLGEAWEAQERRNKLQALVAKQRDLEARIRQCQI